MQSIYGKYCGSWRLAILGFFAISLPLGAQNQQARIYHAQGADFALTVNGERSFIDASSLGYGGIALNRSDMIQTGVGTFLEIQFIPSGTVLKISENTSLVYNGFDESGRFTDAALLYGRIRLVSGNGEGSKTSVIRAGTSSVRIPEGDLGVDYAVSRSGRGDASRPALKVYSFRGRAEVFPFIPGGAPAQAVNLEEGETVLMELNPPLVYAERRPLEKDILFFWNTYNFEGPSPLARPDTELSGVLQDRPLREITVQDIPVQEKVLDAALQGEMARKARRRKTALLTAGFSLTAAGVTAQGIAFARPGGIDGTLVRRMHYTAYVPLGIGLFSILAGILYNPAVPE
ncbi:MAG: hypothetical protein LBS48_02460 [Treponema sp.]|jgi:hypothetical protein|nr:hypothetical protein [Treponema sp.]